MTILIAIIFVLCVCAARVAASGNCYQLCDTQCFSHLDFFAIFLV